jgi:SAM-dependent methyltransferase
LDRPVDFALLYLVWHHVPDQPAAVRELFRVIRPGGILLLRSQFADRMPDLWWLDAFARGRELDAAMYQPLGEVTAMFGAAGWIVGELDEVREPSPGTRATRLAKLQTRSLSLFEHFTEEELATGFAELERRVAVAPELPAPPVVSDLLVLHRPG